MDVDKLIRKQKAPKSGSFFPFGRAVSSFPLYRSRGFIGDIIDHAVDVGDFGDDAGGDPAEELCGDIGELDGHCVG